MPETSKIYGNINRKTDKNLNFEDIKEHLCNKCGTCVGVCPSGALEAKEGRILFNKEKCIYCSICYQNCPGISYKYEEMHDFVFGSEYKGIKDKKVGFHKSVHITQAKDDFLRNNSSAGGALTAVLKEAFEKKLIDGAIVVSMDENKPWKYNAMIAKNIKEVVEARGSKYSIVSLNSILRLAKNFNGKLAFVGLPCHIHGIRKLQKNKQAHANNIVILLGVFCGFNTQLSGTRFLIKKQGIKFKDIKKLEYRGGNWPGGMLITLNNGKKKFLPKYYYDIMDTMFVEKRCLLCYDYMNDFADISFGDIWLEELNREPWSAMIVRTDKGNTFLKKTGKGIKIKELSLSKLIFAHEHNIKHKKVGSILRMNKSEAKEVWGVDSSSFNKKDRKKAMIESIVFRIAGSKIFHLIASVVPLSVMGFAARIRRKIAKKTV